MISSHPAIDSLFLQLLSFYILNTDKLLIINKKNKSDNEKYYSCSFVVITKTLPLMPAKTLI